MQKFFLKKRIDILAERMMEAELQPLVVVGMTIGPDPQLTVIGAEHLSLEDCVRMLRLGVNAAEWDLKSKTPA